MATMTFTASPTGGANAWTIAASAGTPATETTGTYTVYDESTAMNTYLTASDATVNSAIGTYSDGYAIQAKVTAATANIGVDSTAGTFTLQGTNSTLSTAITMGTSFTLTSANNASGTLAHTFTYGITKDVSGTQTAEAVTGTYAGFQRTWSCSTFTPAASGTTSDITCARFQITEANTAATDMRFDPNVTGVKVFAREGAAANTARETTISTWNSAAALVASGAALAVALAF